MLLVQSAGQVHLLQLGLHLFHGHQHLIGAGGKQELSKLLGLVCLLKSPEALEDFTGRMTEGQNVKVLLGRLRAPEPVTMPISGASTRIESQGLW